MIWADSISYTNFMYNKQRMKKIDGIFFVKLQQLEKIRENWIFASPLSIG